MHMACRLLYHTHIKCKHCNVFGAIKWNQYLSDHFLFQTVSRKECTKSESESLKYDDYENEREKTIR
jgi:hypothetical protein